MKKFFRSFVLANKKLTNNDLLLLLEKQESILKDILDFSQLQLAETDPVGLDRIMKNKEICFEELERIVSLIEKWHLEFDRSLTKNEQNKDNNLKDLMERILVSEKDFEKKIGLEKNSVSLQIEHISRQMQYRKNPTNQRAKIKIVKT